MIKREIVYEYWDDAAITTLMKSVYMGIYHKGGSYDFVCYL